MNRRDRIKDQIKRTRQEFQRHEHDTGSSEVQGKEGSVCLVSQIFMLTSAAILTKKIKALEWHMVNNRQDKAAPRIMQKLIHARHKLLVYLRRTRFECYCTIIERLELADVFRKQVLFTLGMK